MPHEVGDTSILEPIGNLAKRVEDRLRVCASGDRPESTYRSPDDCDLLAVPTSGEVVALQTVNLTRL